MTQTFIRCIIIFDDTNNIQNTRKAINNTIFILNLLNHTYSTLKFFVKWF